MLKPRESIRCLSAYHAPAAGRSGLNLDLNENTGGCSPRVLQRLKSLTTLDIARYPEREQGERLVADFLGLSPEQVLLTNGVDEALHLLAETYLGEGDEAILIAPTFTMYPIYIQATGARIVEIPCAEDFAYPTDRVLQAINSRTRLIAIANPNNPTGTTVPRTDLLRVLQAAPDAAVIVDEAYFEFFGQTLLDQLPDFDHLFITRTLSKAYGLAGLRLGALLGAATQVDLIRRFVPPFNVNGVALACLGEALADQEFVHSYVEQVREGRARLQQLCDDLGLHYWPSQANFVLVRVGPRSQQLSAALERRGILVRDRSSEPGCTGCVRITIGLRQHTEQLLAAMRLALADIGVTNRVSA
ncbi:MAG TPA: histidinol-phosphate transaminase [Terriglobales bacterium]|nr:histidinol-phosphate transaminase [Terriglobales bacterium]